MESWDRTEKYTIDGDSIEDNTLSLPADSAHYTVYGVFPQKPEDASGVEEVVYEMEFYFDFRPAGYEAEDYR